MVATTSHHQYSKEEVEKAGLTTTQVEFLLAAVEREKQSNSQEEPTKGQKTLFGINQRLQDLIVGAAIMAVVGSMAFGYSQINVLTGESSANAAVIGEVKSSISALASDIKSNRQEAKADLSSGDKRFYKRMIPIADAEYDEHLEELDDE